MLNDMYWNQHMSSTEICKKFNYRNEHQLLKTIFKWLKIKSKSRHYSLFENFKTGRLELAKYNHVYKESYYTTWDNKTIYLRSSYERDYANYLDENKILYDVEKLRIPYYDSQRKENRIAIPDFYLIETNTIVEIKSYWTLDVINMIDKVKAYKENGYDFKLILEHEETDVYSLIDEPSYTPNGMNITILCKKTRTKIKHGKWKWMNDGSINYKVPENEINEYLNKGFVFGHLQKKK